MPLTVELPDELAEALSGDATRAGMSLPEYAVHLLTTARPAVPVHTGAELVAFWRSEGLVGSRPELLDAPEEARRLREAAQHRGE